MSCTSCNGNCPCPAQCLLPEAKRARTFHPTFGITGPHSRSQRSRRAGWGRLVHRAIGIAAVCFIAAGLFFFFGALGRSKGWF